MIDKLLTLERPLFILDTETMGLDPQRDRIIEIGFQQWTSDGLVKEWRTIVNPGVPIPAAATKVHGITDAKVQNCRFCERPAGAHPCRFGPDDECDEFVPWPRFGQIATNLAKGLSDCDFGGQNIRFDLRMVAAEMLRVNIPWHYDRARILDTSRIEALLYPRDLSSLHAKYTGRPHDGAHGALSDVRATTTVLAAQLTQHPNFPRSLDELHELQWPNFIDQDGKFVYRDGIPHFSNWGKFKNLPMTRADARYWDFILGADFSPDVKRLAADAKLGKFPTKGMPKTE
jgi:DNA polymerase III subunit epsilon